MSKHQHHGAGGKRRREADETGGGDGGDVVTPTRPAHNAKAAALGRHHDKHQRPAHKPHKRPRSDGAAPTPAEQQTEKKKKKKHRHPKKKPGAGAAALAPPPPKPGAGVASLITGSNWAQLRAKLSAEGDGAGGKKRHHHGNRRPTLNELAAGQQKQQEAAADDAANGGKRKKKIKPELRPITALTPASLPGPILTGGSVAMAAAAAVTTTTTTTTTTTVAAAAAGAAAAAAAASAAAPLTQVLAIDCEMVGVGPEGKRSALARVCLVNAQGHVVLDTFVSPKERVTDYRTWVSGVRAQDLKGAPALEEVQRRVAALVAGRVLVGHSLSGDLKALLLSHPRKLVRDTARYPPLMRRAFKAPEGVSASVASDIARGKRRPKALRVLAAQELGLDIQSGEHTPVDDARAALYLYLHHAREWERAIRRGHVARLPVGVAGGAAGVAAAVAAARQARAVKQKKKGEKGAGGGGGGARSNTLDVRELARQDPFADL